MTQQLINIGITGNDRSGDPIRTAFNKVNQNFTEIYNSIATDIQIPSQTGNGGKVLSTNGVYLQWQSFYNVVKTEYNIVHPELMVESFTLIKMNSNAEVSITNISNSSKKYLYSGIVISNGTNTTIHNSVELINNGFHIIGTISNPGDSIQLIVEVAQLNKIYKINVISTNGSSSTIGTGTIIAERII